MKYEGAKPRGIDKDFMGYLFFLTSEEVLILKQILSHVHGTTPSTMDTRSFKNRIKTIMKELSTCIGENHIKPKNFAHSLHDDR